ncbi:MAG: hypothetical protein R3F30_08985 [Planctomycetota bacterium]
MRILILILSLLTACSPTSRSPDRTGEPLPFPAPQEVAHWPISADRARELAVGIMERGPEPRLVLTVTPVLHGGAPIWRVSATDRIANHWIVELDANTGCLMSARRLPGR